MDQLKKQQELEQYKKDIDSKTLKEALEIEKDLIAEADEINKKIAEKTFVISDENYSEVAGAIRHFLEKQEVQWQYTIGLITMYDFWDPDKKPEKVTYPMFDSTIRTLGEMKFKGYDEWKFVVLINDYFATVRDEYALLTEEIWDNASKHNIVIERINLLDPAKSNPASVKNPEL